MNRTSAGVRKSATDTCIGGLWNRTERNMSALVLAAHRMKRPDKMVRNYIGLSDWLNRVHFWAISKDDVM